MEVSMLVGRVIISWWLCVAAVLATSPVAALADTAPDSSLTVDLTSSPPSGDVSGLVTFTATGRAVGGDPRGVMRLLIDGNDDFDAICSFEVPPCTATFKWDPFQFSGTHTARAQYQTNDGRSALSRVLSFRPYSATKVGAIDINPADPQVGKKTVSVRVYSLGHPAQGAVVTATLTPAVGKPATRTATANKNGDATFRYTFKYNTTISVAAGGDNRWGRSTRSQAFTFAPAWSCSLAHATVKHGRPDSITCKVPGLPVGTKVDVAYFATDSRKWITLAKGHSAAGKVTLVFTPKTKGSKTLLRIEYKGARVYQDSSTTTEVKVT